MRDESVFLQLLTRRCRSAALQLFYLAALAMASAASGMFVLPPYPQFEAADPKTERELVCGICIELPKKTIKTMCCKKHICLDCRVKLDKCPWCRAKLRSTEEVSHDRRVGELDGSCSACAQKLKRKEFGRHLAYQCRLRCPAGCETLLSPDVLLEHLRDCPRRQYACRGYEFGCCEQSLPGGTERKTHEASCPYVMMQRIRAWEENQLNALCNGGYASSMFSSAYGVTPNPHEPVRFTDIRISPMARWLSGFQETREMGMPSFHPTGSDDENDEEEDSSEEMPDITE